MHTAMILQRHEANNNENSAFKSIQCVFPLFFAFKFETLVNVDPLSCLFRSPRVVKVIFIMCTKPKRAFHLVVCNKSGLWMH